MPQWYSFQCPSSLAYVFSIGEIFITYHKTAFIDVSLDAYYESPQIACVKNVFIT